MRSIGRDSLPFEFVSDVPLGVTKKSMNVEWELTDRPRRVDREVEYIRCLAQAISDRPNSSVDQHLSTVRKMMGELHEPETASN